MAQFKHRPIPAEAFKWDGTKKGVKELKAAGFNCELDSTGFLRYYDHNFNSQYIRPGEWLLRTGKQITGMNEARFTGLYEADAKPAGSFHDVLQRWEHAFIAVEQDGDDSDAALQEQTAARAALLEMLRQNKDVLAEIGNAVGAPTMQYSPETEREELLARINKVSELVQKGICG